MLHGWFCRAPSIIVIHMECFTMLNAPLFLNAPFTFNCTKSSMGCPVKGYYWFPLDCLPLPNAKDLLWQLLTLSSSHDKWARTQHDCFVLEFLSRILCLCSSNHFYSWFQHFMNAGLGRHCENVNNYRLTRNRRDRTKNNSKKLSQYYHIYVIHKMESELSSWLLRASKAHPLTYCENIYVCVQRAENHWGSRILEYYSRTRD